MFQKKILKLKYPQKRRVTISKVHGEITGLKKSFLKNLANLYKRKVPRDQILTVELAETLAQMSYEVNKEIAIILNRNGQVINISIGDVDKISLPNFKNVREGAARLCGLRCIHTHPKGGKLSRVDLNTLAKLRLDLIIAIGVDPNGQFSKKKGKQANYADSIHMAHLMPNKNATGEVWKVLEPTTLRDIVDEDLQDFVLSLEEEFIRKQTDLVKVDEEERAILVSLFTRGDAKENVEESLRELDRLADTAGAAVIKTFIQKRSAPDPAFYLGKGKAEELSIAAQSLNANLIIVDSELSPRQQKNLEDHTGIKTIDRTELILDIFAQRAHTKEGKLQVELAQLKYLFPRLIGAGLSLSRQMGGGTSGGIATRGPGETKLETDRRAIRRRIQQLERDVEEIRAHRQTMRKKRHQNDILVGALVGYTNAGKSTLINALSSSDVFVEDKLFATLDPTTRRIVMPDHSYVLISDTVGFIQRLPTSLIAAFRATLEEVQEADFILNVVDASHPAFEEQLDTCYDILTELDATDKPFITVFNKLDALDYNIGPIHEVFETVPNPIAISARNRKGLGELVDKIFTLKNELIQTPINSSAQ